MYIFLVTLASNNLVAGARQLKIDHLRKIPYAILNTPFDPYNRSQGIQNQIQVIQKQRLLALWKYLDDKYFLNKVVMAAQVLPILPEINAAYATSSSIIDIN